MLDVRNLKPEQVALSISSFPRAERTQCEAGRGRENEIRYEFRQRGALDEKILTGEKDEGDFKG